MHINLDINIDTKCALKKFGKREGTLEFINICAQNKA